MVRRRAVTSLSVLPVLAACGGEPSTPAPTCADDARRVVVYPDDDGDGFTRSTDAISVPECAVPPGYKVGSSGDCDDADPEVFRVAYEDADGDHYRSAEGMRCVGFEVPPGFTLSSLGYDCNDEDPNAWLSFAPDRDGDGYVDATGPRVCAATAPEGYQVIGFSGLDCDDGDPARHPDAWESFADGIDTDCDGYDDPTMCTVEAAAVANAVVSTGHCSGTDLALVGAMVCAPCHQQQGQVVLRVVNDGSEPSGSAMLSIVVDDGAADAVAVPPLDPGEASPPLTLVALDGVAATLEPGDCDASNDTLTVPVVSVSCTR